MKIKHSLLLIFLILQANKVISQEKLYAQLCCIAYLTNAIHPNNTFKQELKTLLEKYPIVDITAMGFPKAWHNEPLWL